jgi:tRNA(Arg) A34 adenosine deaminase TadA
VTSKTTPPPAPTREVRRALGEAMAATRWDAALLVFDDTAWVTRDRPGALGSAVLRLVLAAHETFIGQEHLAVRQRIWTSRPSSTLDRELVKVSAGKLSAAIEPLADAPPGLELRSLDVEADAAIARAVETGCRVGFDTLSVDGAFRRLDDERDAAERPVAAGLWRDGRLLAVGRSLGESNRALHAELCLALGWLAAGHERLPEGAEVLTTLSPCRMCAAVIDAVGHPSTVVRYRARDPGRLATGTVLDDEGRALLWP